MELSDTESSAEPQPVAPPEPEPPILDDDYRIPIPPITVPFDPEALPEMPDPEDFDLETHHIQLEMVERRIRARQLAPYVTPAQCVDVERSSLRNWKETRADVDGAANYTHVSVPIQIPRFWPIHPWDDPASIMSEEASEKLHNQIRSIATRMTLEEIALADAQQKALKGIKRRPRVKMPTPRKIGFFETVMCIIDCKYGFIRNSTR
jgi:hypothetical protein